MVQDWVALGWNNIYAASRAVEALDKSSRRENWPQVMLSSVRQVRLANGDLTIGKVHACKIVKFLVSPPASRQAARNSEEHAKREVSVAHDMIDRLTNASLISDACQLVRAISGTTSAM